MMNIDNYSFFFPEFFLSKKKTNKKTHTSCNASGSWWKHARVMLNPASLHVTRSPGVKWAKHEAVGI